MTTQTVTDEAQAQAAPQPLAENEALRSIILDAARVEDGKWDADHAERQRILYAHALRELGRVFLEASGAETVWLNDYARLRFQTTKYAYVLTRTDEGENTQTQHYDKRGYEYDEPRVIVTKIPRVWTVNLYNPGEDTRYNRGQWNSNEPDERLRVSLLLYIGGCEGLTKVQPYPAPKAEATAAPDDIPF